MAPRSCNPPQISVLAHSLSRLGSVVGISARLAIGLRGLPMTKMYEAMPCHRVEVGYSLAIPGYWSRSHERPHDQLQM